MLEKFLPRQDFTSYEDFKENFTITIPENFNFGFDVVDAWAETEPDKRALVWCDDHGEERTFTFQDISRLSNKAANWLKAQGIGKGDVVMMILRRRWEYWILSTAITKLGAVIVPASLQLTVKDIVYRVQAASVKMLVTIEDNFVVSQVEQALEQLADKPQYWHLPAVGEGWEAYPDTFTRPTGAEAHKNSDLFLMYFTSGTTGMPKMVCHDFTHPLGHIITAKYWQQVKENGLHMTVSDSGWAKFGWGKIYGQWICGCAVFAYDMDKFVPLKLLQMVEKYKLTSFCAPPTMYRFMLQEDVKAFDLSSVEHCGNAGEPLNPEVYRKWKDFTGLELSEGFGQSESPVLIASFPWFSPRPGSMGKPSPLYDIILTNAEGGECEVGEEGEITIVSRNGVWPVGLFGGYYCDPDYTSRVMYDGRYHTGDVAWRDDDGYFWFVGRNDDVIKCSGYRIGPFEVESALLEHEAVVECAVTAAPDPVRGQVVMATVVLAASRTGSEELTKELQAHVKKVTAPYKYPRIIEYVTELPKTVSGKIKRAQIRSQAAAQTEKQ